MNSYKKFEENWSINAQDRARKRNADEQTDRRTDGRTDGRTDARTQIFFGGYNIIPRTYLSGGVGNDQERRRRNQKKIPAQKTEVGKN